MIYVITLSASDNCGSLLQTYALQYVLQNYLGKEVEILDFSSWKSRQLYAPLSVLSLKNPIATMHRIVRLKKIKKEKEEYQFFREKYLNMTKIKYDCVGKIQNEDFANDIFITGSDQVWNVKMSDFSKAFFLCWKAKRKIAYAASMGNTDISNYKNKEEMIKWLKDFYRISVREDKAKRDLQNYTGISVPVLLDPTLLLEDDEWNNLVDNRLVDKTYIFYYSWNYHNQEFNRTVEEFGKKMNLPVYVINLFRWGVNKPSDYGFSILDKSGPQTYLNLMKHASYVFVESFHGVIFSYIFRKNFWLLYQKDFVDIDARLKSIKSLLHMEHRLVHSREDVEYLDTSDISWDSGSELKEKRGKSLDFLQEALL